MPSSTWHNIETFVEIIRKLKPTSFLDIGVGNGKWGFLFREYTDVWNGRFLKEQWSSVVDGIEIYAPYITENTHQRTIYNNILLGDATRIVGELGPYDVIYAGDVLEHIEKEASVSMLQKLTGMAKMAMICSIPLGRDWLYKRDYENSHEDHISSWEIRDLQQLGFSFYNLTLDPATGRRRIGFFVHTRHDLCITGLKRLRGQWSFRKTLSWAPTRT